MAQAQGIYKTVAFKKQGSGKGSPESGSGGQLLRRETATFNMPKDSFSANEINSHQQHTGDTHGTRKPQGTVAGVISPSTYAPFLGSLLRKDFAATSALTALSITVAADGDNWTITRATGSFLTGGIKVGDVVRLTAGTFNALNLNKNALVLAVTALALTVTVLNGSAMYAEGPIASATLSVPGKKSMTPLSGHTNDYYTIEEWHGDISKSTVYQDMQAGKADIGLPSTGNSTISLSFMGIDGVKSGSQVLTSPTAETTTPILNATNGYLLIGGSRVVIATSASISIDGQMAHGESTIGNKTVTDLTKGDIKVTGSYTSLYEDETTAFDAETVTSFVVVVTENADADADFVTFVIPAIKVMSDDKDDGKKQIIKTNNFTAEINGAGGTNLATDKTTIVIQDSTLS